MKIDVSFIGELKKSKAFNVYEISPKENVFEISIANYQEGSVILIMNLEYEVLNSFGEVIGNFAIDFYNKILVYNLKKKGDKK